MVPSQASRGKEMRKIEIDHQALEDCVKRGLSQLEMAVELNTSQAVVNARLREYGLQSKGGRKSNCDPEQLKRLLLQGWTNKEIADFLHVAPSTISFWIRKNDLQEYKTPIPKNAATPADTEKPVKPQEIAIISEKSVTAEDVRYWAAQNMSKMTA